MPGKLGWNNGTQPPWPICLTTGRPMSCRPSDWSHLGLCKLRISFMWVFTVWGQSLYLVFPFWQQNFWFLFGWEYGEGLGEGMQLSKHISLRAKKKEAKDSHSIKKQAQRVIHVHDSWPFLLTSSSPVVFIFVQHLLNQVPRWESAVIATLSEKIDAQAMPTKGVYCATQHTHTVTPYLPRPSLFFPPSNLGIHLSTEWQGMGKGRLDSILGMETCLKARIWL